MNVYQLRYVAGDAAADEEIIATAFASNRHRFRFPWESFTLRSHSNARALIDSIREGALQLMEADAGLDMRDAIMQHATHRLPPRIVQIFPKSNRPLTLACYTIGGEMLELIEFDEDSLEDHATLW